jgi:hypothetical protein
MKHYILDPGNPHEVKEVGFDEWLEWARVRFEDQQVCRVDKTVIDGDCMVSTVFLGLDHNFLPDGLPILFETLVFGGEHDGLMQRYATWDEAAIGHKEVVEKVMAQTPF